MPTTSIYDTHNSTRKGLILCFCVLTLFSFTLTSQAQNQITFQKIFGGQGADYGSSVAQTSDGGYIMEGHTNSFGAGDRDILIVKMDRYGNVQWSNTYGGALQEFEYGRILETPDSNFVLMSATESFGAGARDALLMKIDQNGNILWAKTYGGYEYEWANELSLLPDGGFIFTGMTRSFSGNPSNRDVYVIRTNSVGDTLWTRIFGGPIDDTGSGVVPTFDNGFIVSGRTTTYGAGGSDAFLIKLDSAGNQMWSKVYGTSSNEYARSVVQAADSGYVMGGQTGPFGAVKHHLIKTDPQGNLSWSKTYAIHQTHTLFNMALTPGSGYLFTGNSIDANSNFGLPIVKTDANGDVEWTNVWNATNTNYDEALTVLPARDGGYMLAGYTEGLGAIDYHMYLIKTDRDGNGGCNDAAFTPTVANLALSVDSGIPLKSGNLIVSNVTLTVLAQHNIDQTICSHTIDSFTQTINLCDGDSVFAGGGFQKTGGIYRDTIISTLYVDSILITDVQVWPQSISQDQVFLCDGDSVFLGGAYQKTAGTYPDTITSANGCDSIRITDLTLYPSYRIVTYDTICHGDSLLIGAQYQHASGTYTDSLQTSNGCDSLQEINLFVKEESVPVANAGQDQEICIGDSAYLNGFGGDDYSWTPTQTLTNPNISDPVSFTDTTITYYMTTTTTCGTDMDSMRVIVHALPPVNAGPDVNILAGDSVQLSASGGLTYLWDPHTGLSNWKIPDPFAFPSTTTQYQLTVTDSNGCTAKDTVIVYVEIVENTTSFNSPEAGIKVLPNPFTNVVTVQYRSVQYSPVQFTIFDVNGKTLQTYHSQATHTGTNQFQLSLTTLPPGIYFSQITLNQNLIYTGKLVKLAAP